MECSNKQMKGLRCVHKFPIQLQNNANIVMIPKRLFYTERKVFCFYTSRKRILSAGILIYTICILNSKRTFMSLFFYFMPIAIFGLLMFSC